MSAQILAFFGGYFTELDSFPTVNSVNQGIGDFQLGFAVLALFISHAISFAMNYVGKGEYKQAKLKELMVQPYSRVVILHITIVIGAFLVMISNAPTYILVILVLLKIFIDVKTHVREHKKYAIKEETRTYNAGVHISDV